MATSFENVRNQAVHEAERGGKDRFKLLRNLDSRQRRALTLFETSREITGRDVPEGRQSRPGDRLDEDRAVARIGEI